MARLSALPDATTAQLVANADVCSICYMDMVTPAPPSDEQQQEVSATVKMTPCGHFYYRVCLKKWLFHQNNCPMCHQVIIIDGGAASRDDGVETEEEELLLLQPEEDGGR